MRSALQCGARWSAERVGVRSAERGAQSAECGAQSAGSVKTSADEEVPNEEAEQLRDTTRLLGDCGSYAVAPPCEYVHSALAASALRSRPCGLGLALERGVHWRAECVGVRCALECEARWRAERVGVRSALECGACWSAERVGV